MPLVAKPPTKRRKLKNKEPEDDQSYTHENHASIKGRAKGPKGARTAAGKLESFMKLPVDIFAEVSTETYAILDGRPIVIPRSDLPVSTSSRPPLPLSSFQAVTGDLTGQRVSTALAKDSCPGRQPARMSRRSIRAGVCVADV